MLLLVVRMVTQDGWTVLAPTLGVDLSNAAAAVAASARRSETTVLLSRGHDHAGVVLWLGDEAVTWSRDGPWRHVGLPEADAEPLLERLREGVRTPTRSPGRGRP